VRLRRQSPTTARLRRYSTKIGNAYVGEVREISDETLIRLPDLGKGSLTALRGKLGLPSTDGSEDCLGSRSSHLREDLFFHLRIADTRPAGL
jgi:hypothetical protein